MRVSRIWEISPRAVRATGVVVFHGGVDGHPLEQSTSSSGLKCRSILFFSTIHLFGSVEPFPCLGTRGHGFPETLNRKIEIGLRGAERASQESGDIPVRHIVIDAQYHGHTAAFREAAPLRLSPLRRAPSSRWSRPLPVRGPANVPEARRNAILGTPPSLSNN